MRTENGNEGCVFRDGGGTITLTLYFKCAKSHTINMSVLVLFFGPCIFNDEEENKPTKCTN